MVDETTVKPFIPNYDFTEADREMAEYVRKKKREILDKENELKLMKLDAEMEDAKTEKFISRLSRVTQLATLTNQSVEEVIEEAPNNDFDAKSIIELVKMFKNNNAPVAQTVEVSKSPPISVSSTVEQLNYTDDQIRSVLSQTPKLILEQLKGYNDNALKDVIISKFGNVNDETIKRSIALLRSS